MLEEAYPAGVPEPVTGTVDLLSDDEEEENVKTEDIKEEVKEETAENTNAL